MDSFQIKILLVTEINMLLLMTSIEINPIYSYALVIVTFYRLIFSQKGWFQKEKAVSESLPQGGLTDISAHSSSQQDAVTTAINTVYFTAFLYFAHQFTPDLMHFITCLSIDSVHLIFSIVTLVIFKGGVIDKPKLVGLTFVEVSIGVIVCGYLSLWNIVLVILVIGIASFRSLRPHQFNLPLIMFMVLYTSSNFIVNIIDFSIYHYDPQKYYEDPSFVESFSFKLYHNFLCILFSYIYSQLLVPGSDVYLLQPRLLSFLFFVSIPSCLMMVCAFLYELTSLSPQTRLLHYKSHISKLFTAVVYFYIFALVITGWIQSIRKYIKQRETENSSGKLKFKRQEEARWLNLSIDYEDATLNEYFDFLGELYDFYLYDNCKHSKDKLFLKTLKHIQTAAAVVFFMLVHIPLSRIHSLFCLLTALIPLVLDKQIKRECYLIMADISNLFTCEPKGTVTEILCKSNLKEALSQRQYKELKEWQDNCVNYAVLHLGIFSALIFNYVYSLYLQAVSLFMVELSIRLLDKIAFEVHFLRLLYFTIYDTQLSKQDEVIKGGWYTALDIGMLFFVIVPLFIIGMKFLTWKITDKFVYKTNSLVAPIAMITFFLFWSYDILWLGIHVFLLNLYVCWFQMGYEDMMGSEGENKYTAMEYVSSAAQMMTPFPINHQHY